MESFYAIVDNVSGFIWGGTWGDAQISPLAPMVVVLLGAGLFFMVVLKGLPLRRLVPAFGELWRGRKGSGAAGEITPWQALSTALSGQVGTGNLAGVATAITLGGPGAIFWMWMTAIVGMAASFAESSLAVKYREKHPDGRVHGGPMYYIRNGLGRGWGWLAIFFAVGTIFSAIATGNMIQANGIATAAAEASRPIAASMPCWAVDGRVTLPVDGTPRTMMVSSCDVRAARAAGTDVAFENGETALSAPVGAFTEVMTAWIPGAFLALLTFLVIIGGIKSIGAVAGRVVPVMAVGYVICSLAVIFMNIEHVPGAFAEIFAYAFGFEQAVGGAAGYGVLQAIRYGVARGLFSNEAGQGSTAIAHAAAQIDNPVQQGEIAMLGAFIDTIVICTMTALVILTVEGSYVSTGEETVRYAWQSTELQGMQVTTAAFQQGIPFGAAFVGLALFLFAFTTIIGWSYYAEQAATYLVGDWAATPVRFIWVGMVFIGALQEVDFIWRLGDIANASMAFPNLIAIVLLSGVVVRMAKEAGRL